MITDERVSSFIRSFSQEDEGLITRIEEEAIAEGVPIIGQETRELLKMLVLLKKPERILEIGSAIGFSSLYMSRYIEKDARITTVEKWKPRVKQARENFSKAGKADVITLIEGDAAQVLKELEGSFDMVFMDAAKGQYIHFLPDIMRLLEKEGIIVSDNVFQNGEVLNSRFVVEKRNRTIHSRMREYLYTITHHASLETAIIPVGDGVTVSIRREA